jgi:type IV secretory pathway VirJ component
MTLARPLAARTRAAGTVAVRALAAVTALLAACAAGVAAPTTPPPPAPPAASPVRAAAAEGYATHLPTTRFGTVTVYIPEGKPQSVAIFVSGDGGWELGVIPMARSLSDSGAVVVGVDIRRYLESLRKSAAHPHAACQMIAADFEALSHQVQKEIGMSEYHVPVLVGYSSGATVVYAALVQSPPGTFAGALSLGFCPTQDFGGAALCPGAGLRSAPNAHHELVLEPAATLKQPWIALQGQQDQVCDLQATDAFVARVAGAQVVRLPLVGHGFGVARNWLPQFRAAYARLATRVETASPPPPDISDLPVQEVPASGTAAEFALLLTGDGGWAGLDQELATRLAANGVPTVGFNSLKYFWSERTPEESARDVARVLRHYLATWNKQRVLLIGYSFGADVLPFVVNRLPPELRARIVSVSLLGIEAHASFEVSIADWVGSDAGGPATQPELARLAPLPVLCIYGEGEPDTICPALPAERVTRERIGKGHHFSGEYALLADRILAFARSGRPVT